MKKTTKRTITVACVVVCCLTVLAAAKSNRPVPVDEGDVKIGGFSITQEEIDRTTAQDEAACQLGYDEDTTREAVIRQIVLQRLLEEEFANTGITLTAAEQQKADEYLDTVYAAADEDEAARVQSMVAAYCATAGMTDEEFAAMVAKLQATQYKQEKLLSRHYSGDAAKLAEKLEKECERLMEHAGYDAA
jgi:hypothetical protein